jgi:OOP family OmpA-OmpF porin
VVAAEATVMSRLSSATCVVALALAFSSQTQAQVDAQRFKPALSHDGWLNAEGSAVRHPDDPWELALWLNYAKNPLVVVGPDGDISRSFVSDRVGLDAIISVSLTKRLSLAAGLPVFFLQSGDAGPSSAGIGDVRVAPKLQLLSDVEDGIGLALLAEVQLPTHTGDFSGGDGLSVLPKAVIDHRFRSGVRLGFNLGAAVRSSTDFFNVKAGSELGYAAALGYRFGGLQGRTEIGLELVGGLGLVESDPEEIPLEALAFLRHAFSAEWELTVGAGPGVLEGYGTPSLRALVGVKFAPTSHDRDGDRVSDSEDQCPDDPEDRDGVDDADGCPDEDADFDRDGVSDLDDDCPDAKETINGIDDEDGCPDSGDRRVIYEEGHFTVMDAIRFEHGSAEITQDSHPLLDQIALTLKANPEIERMRVEGHTDDTGPRDVNMQLSEARAHSVRRYLIARGVSPNRLNVRSYGPDRPVEEGKDADARARNRRVEFVLE